VKKFGLKPVRSNSNRSIAIVGGGISGVTTAILLHTIGYRTVLYTRTQPSYGPDTDNPPEFATLHAAASVLPHSVASSRVSHWTSVSQQFFRALSFRACCGVRSQVHYEIFEDFVLSPPAYSESVENFEFLDSDEMGEPWVPRRSGARKTYGWKFDAFFCEAPEYVRYLYSFYGAIGGRVLDTPGDGNLIAYLELNHDVYVNCTGVGSHSFLASSSRDRRCADAPMAPDFEPLIDPLSPKLIRGHYLRIGINEILTGTRARFLSYNYKPLAEIYRTTTGVPADVYCYPRSDAWILGGSRQEGGLDENGNWVGERTVGQEIEFARPGASALAVPAPILELNADILRRMTGGELDLMRRVNANPSIVSPGIGYRFVRDSASDSVRVGCSRVTFSGVRKYILHNYGHGGSGFTLSWGCAFDVLQLLRRVIGRPPEIPAEQRKFAVGYAATHALLVDLVVRLLSYKEDASR
jgi:D-amino-acid oxidase